MWTDRCFPPVAMTSASFWLTVKADLTDRIFATFIGPVSGYDLHHRVGCT